MINQVNSQPMISCPQMNMPKQEAKNIVISASLLMRLFEWCHEDAKDDNDMHQALENIMSFNDGINPLRIEVFDCIVPETVETTESCVEEPCQDYPCATEEDISCASEIGACLANAGVDISNVPYSDVAPIIIQNRNNEDLEGYGASNSEIESFWDGYESVDPMTLNCSEEESCCQEPCEPEIETDLQAEIDNIINSCIG